MRLDTNKLSSAVRLALSLSTVASVGMHGNAQAQSATGSNTDQSNQSLETIVVTGSNIRRVDIETANPVITINRAAIESSGKLTLGDLIQSLPSNAGSATNPNINNGGGTGASSVSLRGLGSARTLLLIDGHRIPSFIQDLNLIPATAVERIEVLSDGASAVYGSDAVGGVVNVIMRTNYQGAEFGTDYGISDRDDGQRKAYHITLGQATDKGHILIGLNYNEQDAVSAANRAYSKDALYMQSGSVISTGSSHTPNGRIAVPASLLAQLGCPPTGDGAYLTKLPGAQGTSAGDYRCYNPATDAFNFQAVGNYDLVPSNRTGVFLSGAYKLTDDVEAYVEEIHNKTNANSQEAPEIFNAQAFGLTISSQNYYNPFGVDFGPGAYDLRGRLIGLGSRATDFGTTVDQLNAGFKINFGDSNWVGKVNFGFVHFDQDQTFQNFVNFGALVPALGPSFQDPVSGAIECGSPGNVIAGCTPLNIFDVNSPANAAILRQYAGSVFKRLDYQMKEVDGDVNGTLFDLPAGSVQLAAGVSDRKEHENFNVDSVAISNAAGTCAVPSTCSSPTEGGFDVKEAYAELLVPVLKDAPFAHSLNIDVGERYSKYSNFGSTSNWKAALEYRPIEDLLLRGTVSKVFRAPNITDIFGGPAISSPSFSDPCVNLQPGQTNAACQYITVTPGHPFVSQNTSQTNAVISGSQYAGYDLTPEFGKSFDYGFVYDPTWLPGLSISSDIYRIYLNNLILVSPINDVPQIVASGCYAGVTSYCSLIHRFASGPSQGQINYIAAPAINAGRLDTKGADFAAHYRLPETSFGNFRASFQATYMDQYNINSGISTQELAGHYDKQYGNFTRWRALGSLDWSSGPWTAMWQMQYVGPMVIGYVSPAFGPTADNSGCYDIQGGPCASVLHFGSYVYHNVSLGYNIEAINTQIQVGIDNLSNKQPPIIFLENNTNPTDGSTYNTIGRFYWVSLKVKF